MASIFRRKPNGPYYFEYTDEYGNRPRKSTGTKDRRLAWQIATAAERAAAERRAGLAAPHAGTTESLDVLIDEYIAELKRLGRVPNYIRQHSQRIRRIIEKARWKKPGDIRPAEATRFLNGLAQKAPRTINAYRDSIVWFCAWMVRTERLLANPLSRLSRARAIGVRFRRALTATEVVRLAAVAPPHRGFTYSLMALSGLRWHEARVVTVGEIDTSRPIWYWRLKAETTKSRRDELLPMTPECQELIGKRYPELARLKAGTRLCATMPSLDTFRRDLATAGIPATADDGRIVGFHSLRYTFCTTLAQVLPIQTVRILMRHKDINLTIRVYLDLGLTDVADGVQKLPRIFPDTPEADHAQ